MLTGDQNIVNVHFRVIWQIDPAHPEDFVFNVLNPRETVKAVAESVMREVVGLKTIDGILTSDRKSIEPDAQKRMQNVLERLSCRRAGLAGAVAVGRRAGAGHLRLSRRDRGASRTSSARSTTPTPTPTASSPRPKGAASRILAEAEAYKQQTVLDAQGPDRALQPDLRPIQEGARRDARAHVSRDDGAGARRHEQDHPRRARRRARRCLIWRSTRRPRSPRERRNEKPVQRPGDPDRRRRRRSSSPATRSSPSIRPSRRWCCASASRSATSISEPGLHVKVAVRRLGRLHRQAHSRARQRAPGGAGRREPAARSRRLRALPHRRSAAVLPDRCSTVQGANAQLGGMLNSALRRTLSDASILDIVRNKRDDADGATSATR